MTILNVSFGIFAFLPQGWLFMAFVIAIECFLATRFLSQQWISWKIFTVISLTNIISGIFGIVVSMILNGGWYLVVWFPWVSSHEMNLSKPGVLEGLVYFYMATFIVTIILEALTNVIFLKKYYGARKILKMTLAVNIISYLIGTIVLYSYSFK